MDSSDVTTALAIGVCIMFSAYFSSTETAFSSLNKARLKNMVKNDEKGAQLAYDLSEDYNKVISTILIGNNIVNIIASSLATILFTSLIINKTVAVVASTVVMTIIVLIFGEVTPKTIAKEIPEKLSILASPLLRFFMIVLKPLNYPFAYLKILIYKICKFETDKAISDEELITIVEEAEQDGGFDEHESKLIRSAIEFNDCDVVDVLTSRLDLVAIPSTYTMTEVRDTFLEHGFSRLPVYDQNMDQITGFIHEKDFYHILFDEKESFESIIKPIHCTVPKTKISALLRELQLTKSHISLVVDEFGSSMGIVTIEDILEELVGEIWDEHDEVVLEFTKVSEYNYKVLSSTNIDDFFELFEIKHDIEKYEDVQTVSGWVIEEIGNIPNIGDTFTFENLTITVSKTDYRRIIEIEVLIDPSYEKENELVDE
ncbi:MAG: hemolysin family protein [Clostridia bacterium]